MFSFDKKLPTTKRSKGINKKRYIILHHTPWSFDTIARMGSWDAGKVSYPFVIGQNAESAKIGDPDDILRHCWPSAWGEHTNLNSMAIGIEFCFPAWQDPSFTKKQFTKWVSLVKHLMKTFGIPKENVLTHTMITNGGTLDNVRKNNYVNSKAKLYYKPGHMCRKVDVHHCFWQSNGFPTFRSFQDYLGS